MWPITLIVLLLASYLDRHFLLTFVSYTFISLWSDECKSSRRFEYFIFFIDDYSRYSCLYVKEHKSESLEKSKEYKTEVENLLSKKIKIHGFEIPRLYDRT